MQVLTLFGTCPEMIKLTPVIWQHSQTGGSERHVHPRDIRLHLDEAQPRFHGAESDIPHVFQICN